MTSQATDLWFGHTPNPTSLHGHERHGRRLDFSREPALRGPAQLIGGRVIISEQLDSGNHDQNDTIGGRIGRAREASGLSVAQAARRLGVKTGTWRGWENYRAEPRSRNQMINAATMTGNRNRNTA